MPPPAGFVYLRHDPFALTLLGVATVIVIGRLAGRLCTRIGQPPVIGEVIAGIALGPSLLGGWSNALFPARTRPLLGILATLGLVVFMFLVGLELDLAVLDGAHRRTALAVGTIGTLLPFGLGVLLSLALHPSHHTTDLLPFALFLGAAMSTTAFPVLARHRYHDQDEHRGHDGDVGKDPGARRDDDGDDQGQGGPGQDVATCSRGHGQRPQRCVAQPALLRPRLAPYGDRDPGDGGLALAVAAVLACALATSAIGIHAIFGPFLLGAVFPRGALTGHLRGRLGPVAALLMPVFFVTTGLHVDIGGIDARAIWQLGLVLLVACAGKLVGATAGARLQGIGLRESVALGALMNTRGLTELVVLDVGRELGVLDGRLFTLLVVMAVVTTVATAPLLALVRPDPWLGRGGVKGSAEG